MQYINRIISNVGIILFLIIDAQHFYGPLILIFILCTSISNIPYAYKKIFKVLACIFGAKNDEVIRYVVDIKLAKRIT